VFVFKKMYYFEFYLPTREFSFSQTQLQAVLSGCCSLLLFAESFELVTLYSIETPCSFTWFYAQTRLLCVYRKHRKLGLAQCSFKKKGNNVNKKVVRIKYENMGTEYSFSLCVSERASPGLINVTSILM